MNIIPGVLTAIGAIKYPSSGGRTAPAPAGAPAIGSGVSVALSDGRQPGKIPASEQYSPVFPTIVDDPSKIGAILDKSL
jgi:hypothetical protein